VTDLEPPLRTSMPHAFRPPAARDLESAVRSRGLTLVEVAITVAILALLTTMAVPNYLGSRAESNEAAVVATLRSLVDAQAEFRLAAYVDRDGDGTGEYGTLGELAGRRPLPGKTSPVDLHLLPSVLGETGPDGRALCGNYWFAIYLADVGGRGTADTPGAREAMDPEFAERRWTCIAWPVEHGVTGEHTYFVNEQGEVRRNRTERYSGTDRVPPAGAALVYGQDAHQIARGRLATNELGADGGVWLPVK
jgi:prepilin-type N-terminal cleavage/methylation domain-containing protein